MSPRAEVAPRKAPRRSHAERTAQTRARIMDAVVASVSEVGFPRTTASEIARRAGVTWGAVQHHFGGKEGILAAVLEDSFDRFAQRLSDIEVEGAPLERRVELFIDRAWEHFESPHFRSTFENLHHSAGAAPRRSLEGAVNQAAPGAANGWQAEMLLAWNRIWSAIFDDAHLSPRRRLTLQHYTISCLAGLAAVLRFESPPKRVLGDELALLKDTLARELRRA
jgi:AcrR family transcriptional regulator